MTIHDKLPESDPDSISINLLGANVTDQQSQSVTVQLSNQQRIDALTIMDTAAGAEVLDPQPILFTYGSNAIFDMSGNRNTAGGKLALLTLTLAGTLRAAS